MELIRPSRRNASLKGLVCRGGCAGGAMSTITVHLDDGDDVEESWQVQKDDVSLVGPLLRGFVEGLCVFGVVQAGEGSEPPPSPSRPENPEAEAPPPSS